MSDVLSSGEVAWKPPGAITMGVMMEMMTSWDRVEWLCHVVLFSMGLTEIKNFRLM